MDASPPIAAEGWLELGDWHSANAELDNITAERRAHPDVLEVRWQVSAKAGKWDACVDIGKALTQLAPDRAVSWIHHAFALHELKRTKEAWDVLSPVAHRFPTESTMPYNLACYAAQMENLIEARDLLAQAFKLGDAKQMKLIAMDDPDLAALWQEDESD